MSKLFSILLITALLAVGLVGCGGKLEETYTMVTLREAALAGLKSPGFKFGFDSPHFITAKGDLALVREGNLIEFFTGVDIESKIGMVEGRKFVVGARKIFSPTPHFTVDFMIAGGDTIKVGEPYGVKFPAIIKGFDESDFEEVNLNGLTSNVIQLKDIYETKFRVANTTISYEEVNYKGEPEMAYLLNLEKVRFILEDLSPDVELIVKALIAENLYFDGGVYYGEKPSESLFPRSYRNATKIGGKIRVEFLRYAGDVIAVTQ
ncbi:MAG: hypothetical protein JXB45_01935 [Candidatus Krumholzibacteriota bacterium]|nr:hypothetical protein [Candidatus Krumholzibacteriota bacterium]